MEINACPYPPFLFAPVTPLSEKVNVLRPWKKHPQLCQVDVIWSDRAVQVSMSVFCYEEKFKKDEKHQEDEEGKSCG